MANRNRAAVDVQFFGIDLQAIPAIHHLYREASLSSHRSMSLNLIPARCNNFGAAKSRPIPISSGSQPATWKPRKTSLGDAELVCTFARHQQRGRRAVRKLRRVPGGNCALATGLIEVRFQSEKAI